MSVRLFAAWCVCGTLAYLGLLWLCYFVARDVRAILADLAEIKRMMEGRKP